MGLQRQGKTLPAQGTGVKRRAICSSQGRRSIRLGLGGGARRCTARRRPSEESGFLRRQWRASGLGAAAQRALPGRRHGFPLLCGDCGMGKVVSVLSYYVCLSMEHASAWWLVVLFTLRRVFNPRTQSLTSWAETSSLPFTRHSVSLRIQSFISQHHV